MLQDLWDGHIRRGGAVRTELTSSECPPSTSGMNADACKADSLVIYLVVYALAHDPA